MPRLLLAREDTRVARDGEQFQCTGRLESGKHCPKSPPNVIAVQHLDMRDSARHDIEDDHSLARFDFDALSVWKGSFRRFKLREERGAKTVLARAARAISSSRICVANAGWFAASNSSSSSVANSGRTCASLIEGQLRFRSVAHASSPGSPTACLKAVSLLTSTAPVAIEWAAICVSSGPSGRPDDS